MYDIGKFNKESGITTLIQVDLKNFANAIDMLWKDPDTLFAQYARTS
jgi:hypothetical protein